MGLIIVLTLTACGPAEDRSADSVRPGAAAATARENRRPTGADQPTGSPSAQADGRAHAGRHGEHRGGTAPAADAQPGTTDRVAGAHPFPRRQPAPPLVGGTDWINTDGPLDLQQLRGKFVVLDFWTYCCINCMHILPELKKLEAAYPNELVVIGVHCAKFATERDSDNIREAVVRYGIEHPVVNDADMKIWDAYAVTSWPSLRVIDPEGFLVGGQSGEITFEPLDAFLKRHLPYYRRAGTLRPRPLTLDLEASHRVPTPLAFPGKVLADEALGQLFIADSNHHRVVVTDLAGKLQHVIGAGEVGWVDGDYATCRWNRPQGMALVGQTLYVADTGNHLLRKVDLPRQQVTTVAGTGAKSSHGWPGLEQLELGPLGQPGDHPDRWVGDPKTTPLNSPWSVWADTTDLYVAMAGSHQIWKMPLDEHEIGPYAGNGREDIVDGPLLPQRPYAGGYASFAQPSGLTSDGQWLYVADSEGSSIRAVPFNADGHVKTVIGTAYLPSGRLFTFGDRDGIGRDARFQHALGVVYHDGRLYVADTYNNKIKAIELKDRRVTTVAGTVKAGRTDRPARFDEPAGIAYAAGRLYVADTNNHVVRTIDLHHNNRVATLTIAGLHAPRRPAVAIDAAKR